MTNSLCVKYSVDEYKSIDKSETTGEHFINTEQPF